MNLLDHEQFQALLQGSVRTDHTTEGVALHRLTKRQVDYYETTNEAWGVRANCTAGVMLRLVTDSPSLDLTGRILDGARTYAGLDVEIDGRQLKSLRIDTSDETRTFRLLESVVDPTAADQREICITFPQSAIVELDAIEVADGSTVQAPPPKSLKYLAIGDSITQGMDARGPTSIYPVQLARMLDAELLNIGVGGHVYDLDALDDDLPFSPDLVTVAYGTNDWSRDLTQPQIQQIVTQYLTRLQATVAASARVFVLTPIWRKNGDQPNAGGTLVEFGDAIAEAAHAIDGMTVIDGSSLVPHRDDLFADGVHPTDEGFLHYAINLYRAIRSHQA